MKFSELVRCPFCGCTEYYNKFHYHGNGWYFSNFDGTEAENTDMYDCLSSSTSGRAYCQECNRYLGNSNTGILGKRAEAALRKETEHD